MGVSTDGMLVYGYIWTDEYDLFDGEDSAVWIERIAVERGATNPWKDDEIEAIEQEYNIRHLSYHEYKSQSDTWVANNRARIDAWYEARRVVEAEFPVTIDHHGSDEWRVPIVTIKAARKRAARGFPVALSTNDLAIGEEWDVELARFVEVTSIDTSEAEGPGWFLCSWWG